MKKTNSNSTPKNNSKKPYDFLIVGSGLFGSVFARRATDAGKKALVIDKRDHIGGNCASYKTSEGIDVHKYGAHIFHTDIERVWQFINKYTKFNNYINTPIANYNGKMYPLPFNMFTFYALWGTATPEAALTRLEKERAKYAYIVEPKNLEQKALTLVGEEIYEKLIKGYTEKQWGKKATELPAFIISRLPFRLEYDNNYFADPYQGIPVDGYNVMFKSLLKGIEVKLSTDYFGNKEKFEAIADRVVYTGAIDTYFNCSLGELEYRSLKFENKILDVQNLQGVAVVNYTDSKTKYTRVIEHKHFRAKDDSFKANKTIVSYEYPAAFNKENPEPYYVVNDNRNNSLYAKYKELAIKETKEKGTIFGGRLAEYRYYDMDDVILSALEKSDEVLKK